MQKSKFLIDRPYDAPWGNGGPARFGGGGRDFDDFGGPGFGGNSFGGGGNGYGNGGPSGFGGGFADDFGPGRNSFGSGTGFGNGGSRSSFNDELFCVHLRGLPYDCLEKEVFEFFNPIRPTGVDIIYNNRGRHSGEADAFFSNYDEGMLAMKKDKAKMGARYIELFFRGNGKNAGNGNGSGGRRF